MITEKKKNAFIAEMNKCLTLCGITKGQLLKCIGLSRSAWWEKEHDFEKLTVGQLRTLKRVLNLPDEAIIDLVKP